MRNIANAHPDEILDTAAAYAEQAMAAEPSNVERAIREDAKILALIAIARELNELNRTLERQNGLNEG